MTRRTTPAPDSGAGTPVLITGCSSGIGRATALRLHGAGRAVYATARRPETLRDLAAAGIRTLQLDVTDEDSMATAVAKVEAEHGAVGALVNSAGYALSGAVESASPEAVRAQFETNVFGLVRLTQLVLPAMRARGAGTVVNVSSIFGRYAVPGGGFYHATKHAVEALSDALRLEAAPFGVRVVLVEPGPVRTTEFGAKFAGQLGDGGSGGTDRTGAQGGDDGPYGAFHRQLADYFDAIYTGGRRTLAGTFAIQADDVAAVVAKALRAPRPRSRYTVGFLARSTIAFRRLAPDVIFDNLFVRRQFPVPRAPGRPQQGDHR
ncbi:SDR family NAD(P)-dependent oxidoreductase [Streptomyces sp. B1866]|uniref:SDR family NAD(P)-dependent oxidoreductase n=1 Tax=Streptomyces sp. B1866 TaxID=3075431 RepID=UPI002891A84C|nr:SDR family NAD(P)-dependent oxidoreductase [Streptomyces sp. B1866]MDT3395895.1 SDR family NAD(P)-dependent oxidoreductase [Streptomyces sp. B1866]